MKSQKKKAEPHGFRAGWSRDHSARLHMILPWIDSQPLYGRD